MLSSIRSIVIVTDGSVRLTHYPVEVLTKGFLNSPRPNDCDAPVSTDNLRHAVIFTTVTMCTALRYDLLIS